MMPSRLKILFICAALFTSGFVLAADVPEPNSYLPTDSLHASWVFSGVVTNESGDNYGYFFQMDRNENDFHVISALFDEQNKSVIVQEESNAVITESALNHWRIGRAFLRFNPINDSWIFGLKTKDKKGFNFKVDMLRKPENGSVAQNLRPGVDFLISQTSQLNGHVQTGDDHEQFVTAKNAWFRQVWLTKTQAKSHPFSGVLCRFDDGSGFYSVNMLEPDAMRGAEAGWFDAKGMSSVMSQFINVKQSPDDGPWHIRVGSPHIHLVLSDYIKNSSVVAGFIAKGNTPGFCMLSSNAIGEKKIV